MISEANARQDSEYLEVLEPSRLKVRPIVAYRTCRTRPLSDLLEILEPFILHVKSYVRDDIDFFERCSRVNN